ncbi:protein DpdG [Rugosimonospora acidiphila]
MLNPPRSLPGLARSLVNFLAASQKEWSEKELIATVKPEGLNDDKTAGDGISNTLAVLRAINMLSTGDDGAVSLAEGVRDVDPPLNVTKFRRLLHRHIFDAERDGDPWTRQRGDGDTSGARDLVRALSWFLAQDALGEPLSWVEKVQPRQSSQFKTDDHTEWAIQNDTRWGAFSRWAPALGFATPLFVRSRSCLVPLPVVAIEDALVDLPLDRLPVDDFLARLARRIPVIHGGAVRTSLVARLESDPDPGVTSEAVDSSVGQALRILEGRGRLLFERLPDAKGTLLSRFDEGRVTHVTVVLGAKK